MQRDLPGESLSRAEYLAPRNETGHQVAAIWAELLQVEPVGIGDDFFKLGGNSLTATTFISRIYREFQVELPLRQIFQTPMLASLAAYLTEAVAGRYTAIRPIAAAAAYPMSAAQKRLYVIHQLDPANLSYNLPGAFSITGKLDAPRLEETFRKLIGRHESLRTSFIMAGAGPVQQVHAVVEFAVSCREAAETELAGIISEFIRPFDLSQPGLLRVALIKLSTLKHLLLFDMHHIISDGTSMGILIREFIDLYQGRNLPELRIQYKDYAVWQNEFLKTERIKQQEEYWLVVFQVKSRSQICRPTIPRPPVQSFAGDRIEFEIGPELTQKSTGWPRKPVRLYI